MHNSIKTLGWFVFVSLVLPSIACAVEPQKIDVSMTEYRFEMPTTARPGKTAFVIKNAGKRVHTIEIKGEGLDQKLSPNLKPGETGTLQVDLKPGSYVITCPVDFHTARGMKTTLTVKS